MKADISDKKQRRAVRNLIMVQFYYERIIKTKDNGNVWCAFGRHMAKDIS